MSTNKRNSDSVNYEVENLLETDNDKGNSNPIKKLKKDERKEVEIVGGHHDGSATPGTSLATSSSMKPMERRKKRKALDKERHRVAIEDEQGLRLKESNIRLSINACVPYYVFKDLASADFSVREAAVERLVWELTEVQKAFDMVENKELVGGGLKLEAEKDDGLHDCAPSLRYALRRLIRGVSSSRECARQGFAVGLTALIGTISNISLDSLLKLIVELLDVSSSMMGQEVRDCLLGHLFAYGAIARSGRLTEEWVFDQNSSLIKEFSNILISLAAKKRYLQEPAIAVILELLPSKAVVSHVLEAPQPREWIEGATAVGNPDTLLLALKVREKVSVDSVMFGNILPYPFSPSKFFSPDHLFSLANLLQGMFLRRQFESTFCQPQVHSLWRVLVNILLHDTILQGEDIVSACSYQKKHKKSQKSNSFKEEVSNNIQSFCEVVIEGSLLQSSHDRKHLAFDILLLLLPKLPTSFLSYLMSYKLVQYLMDVLSTKDSWLYKVVQHFLKELSDWVGNDVMRQVALVVVLQKHSNGKFNCITRTKTVKSLLAEVSTESGCMLYIQDQMINEPSDQSQTTDDNSEIGLIEDKGSVGAIGNSDFLKTWIVESFPSILKYLNLDPEAKFRVRKEILKFLAVQGLFYASLGLEVTSFELQEKFRWPKAAASTAICRICIEQIQSLLASAQKLKVSCLHAGIHDANDVGSYFMRFINKLHNIPSVSLFRPLNDEDEKAFKRLQKPEIWLYKLKGYESSGFIEDLDEELDNDTNSQFIDVLLDTLLSLLPQSSAPIRFAIEQVFKSFVREVTNDGLIRMLHVVKKELKPSGEIGDGDQEGDADMDDSEAVGEVEEVGKELSEDIYDSDEGMDDDAIETKNQAGNETAQSQLVLFKLRVLSLLEIYLQEKPGDPQVLTVYSNLAQAFVNPHTMEVSEQLGQRIWGILQKKISKVKDFPSDERVQLSTLETLLEKSLKLASKPFNRREKKKTAHTPSKKKQSNSTFWLLKIVDGRHFSESELQRILDLFRTVLMEYFENSKRSQIKSEFLKEIFGRRPWNLRNYVQRIGHLVTVVVTNMPEKKARRIAVLKFCGKVFQMISTKSLNKSFLKTLGPGGCSCL
ncbi:hypothetical protein K2173_023972 [Erythroxylum novogranatense]|uniref:Uncharacterized protein n=1 Tax=Erythroxylum novogranatense TaxID=1862640 RepID=A0AAV8TQ25_9ROSI|nr:hypothetical protein K2173_023972 [Erythroxylum novogranatense]